MSEKERKADREELVKIKRDKGGEKVRLFEEKVTQRKRK